MKVIIAGSRTFSNYPYLQSVMEELDIPITEIVSGTAKGADKLGEQYAKDNNIPIKQFPADWDKYGKAAGFLRNKEMANYADALVAFWDGSSRGTKHMISIAEQRNLKTVVKIKL